MPNLSRILDRLGNTRANNGAIWNRIYPFSEDDPTGWDMSSPQACQDTIDIYVEFKTGVTKPTGDDVFNAIATHDQWEADEKAIGLDNTKQAEAEAMVNDPKYEALLNQLLGLVRGTGPLPDVATLKQNIINDIKSRLKK